MNINQIDTIELMDYEVAKERLSYKLRPEDFEIKGISMDYLNMKVEPVIIMEKDEKHIKEIPVTDEMLEAWDKSKEKLLKDMMENAPRIHNIRCEKIGGMIEEMMEEDPELRNEIDDFDSFAKSDFNPPLFVVTNDEMFLGAGAVFYSDFLDKISKEVGDNMYILPSSQHEIILCPESMHDYKTVNEMVQTVNRTEVAPDEILSDFAYVYDKEHEFVSCPALHIQDKVLSKKIDELYEQSQNVEDEFEI